MVGGQSLWRGSKVKQSEQDVFFLSFADQAFVFEAKAGALTNKNHAFVRKLFAAQASGADQVTLIRPSHLKPARGNETDKIIKGSRGRESWIDKNLAIDPADPNARKQKVLASQPQADQLKKLLNPKVVYIDQTFRKIE